VKKKAIIIGVSIAVVVAIVILVLFLVVPGRPAAGKIVVIPLSGTITTESSSLFSGSSITPSYYTNGEHWGYLCDTKYRGVFGEAGYPDRNIQGRQV